MWFDVVHDGPELRRILALPRDVPVALTEVPAGLRPIQAQALRTYQDFGRLVAVLGVGAGKSLIAGHLAQDPGALVLSTAAGVKAMVKDWHKHGLPAPRTMTYSTLSHPKHAHALTEARPRVLVADEASALMNWRSIVHKRVRAYLRANPHVRFVPLTATGINRSLVDIAAIFEWALGPGSPLPRPSRHWAELSSWAEALDPGHRNPRGEGALVAFDVGQGVLHGLGAWIRATPGVLTTPEVSTTVALTLTEVPHPPSKHLDTLDTLWADPDGRPILSVLDYTRTRGNLTLGGYYRSTEDPEARAERLDWQLRLRTLLKASRTYDSPARLLAAVPDAMPPRPPDPEPGEWVWVDDAAVDYAVRWATAAPGVVWVGVPALGEAVAARAGIPYHGAGSVPAGDGTRSVVASYHAHAKGHNLQAWHRALVLGGPTSAATWTQLLGRHHRAGQTKDVMIGVYAGTLDKSRIHATWLQTITGERHRLL